MGECRSALGPGRGDELDPVPSCLAAKSGVPAPRPLARSSHEERGARVLAAEARSGGCGGWVLRAPPTWLPRESAWAGPHVEDDTLVMLQTAECAVGKPTLES